MQYLVSKYDHEVKAITGPENSMRVLWMFGWNVDGDEWELRQHREING